MHRIGAFAAKNQLGALLDRVERGEQIIITRHGKPVAQMMRPSTPFDSQASDAAFARIRARAEALHAGPFDWDEYRAWRDEGKR